VVEELMAEDIALKEDLEDDETEEESEESEESEGEEEAEGESEEATDNVGDPSVEINVEELIHELESQGLADKLDKEVRTRRRLEELIERRRASRDLEDYEI
jgi:hypothetical protein